MSSNPLIKYFEVTNTTDVLEVDENNKVAVPSISSKGKKWVVEKGKYVKSFGQLGKYKTQAGKQEVLTLVNGQGIVMKDLKLYKDNVDDCGCDGNPVATPSDLDKANQEKESSFDKEAAYVKPKSMFDRSAIIGLLIGALLGAAIMWFATKNKKKAIIGAVVLGILGAVVGYFMGKRGEKQIEILDKPEDVEKDTDAPDLEEKPDQEAGVKAESKEFLQLGEKYDFVLPASAYAMMYSDGTFYVARKGGNKFSLKPGVRYSGKLVEVDKPQFFVADPKTKKVVKMKSQKPLPFIDFGNRIYLPLSMTDKSAVITTDEAMDHLGQLGGGNDLEKEIYVKGRYAGKRLYNLMYFPSHESTIRQMFGKK